jgi:hypothetical protein
MAAKNGALESRKLNKQKKSSEYIRRFYVRQCTESSVNSLK